MLTKVWDRYPANRRKEYEDFLRMYGSLSSLFNQKSDKSGIPYLDSKFQETIFARSFNDKPAGIKSKDVDYGNTPHDILSVFPGNVRIGIGIKTWLYSHPTYQKVAQIKSYRSLVSRLLNNYLNQPDPVSKDDAKIDLIQRISMIKNESLERDYKRLGLQKDKNIYNYVTRDQGKLHIQETSYPEINTKHIRKAKFNKGRKNKHGKRGLASISFTDGRKNYRFGFADSQFFMQFNANKHDHKTVSTIPVKIMKDPFGFLKDAFNSLHKGPLIVPSKQTEQSKAVYLPLYSPRTGDVQEHSGLNARIGKSKASKKERKRNPNYKRNRNNYEAYIPISRTFNKLNKHWLNPNIDLSDQQSYAQTHNGRKSIPIVLHWPNGESCKAIICQQGFKSLQTNPQSFLGKWILKDYFGKGPLEPLTSDDLYFTGHDSIKLWHQKPGDYKDICIDMAPWGSYRRFIYNEEHK